MEPQPHGEKLQRFEIAVPDRAAAEALWLELRRLARRCGIQIAECRIEKATGEPDRPSP